MSFWFRRLVPTSPLGRAVFFASVLFLGWASWHTRRELRHPFWDLSRGTFSDHFSHLSAVRLFAECGACVWRVPTGWSQIVRPYPPGELVLMAPFAVMYHARVAVIVVASLVVFGNGLFPSWLGQVLSGRHPPNAPIRLPAPHIASSAP